MIGLSRVSRLMISAALVIVSLVAPVSTPELGSAAQGDSPAAGWFPAGEMPSAAGAFQAASVLPDGKVLLVSSRASDLYDPATNTWAPGPVPTALHTGQFAMATLPNGGALLLGPDLGLNTLEATAEIYDEATNSWKAAAPMLYPALEAQVATLHDGRVLVAGGCPCFPGIGNAMASSQIYAPSTNTWSDAGAMPHGQEAGTATTLLNGDVLVAGGWLDEGTTHRVTADAELYDPATGTWTATGSMHVPRENQSATLLPDGSVLVAGGDDYTDAPLDALSSSEIYDPRSGEWTLEGNMRFGRRYHTATLLPDGTVLVAGGENRAEPVADSEIYNPATATWSISGLLAHPRLAQAAVLLADGSVLIAGGTDHQAAVAAAERYGVRPPPTPTAVPPTPSPTPTVAPMDTPTARPTHTPVTLSVSIRLTQRAVKAGHRERVIVSAVPRAHVTVKVTFPQCRFKHHGGYAGPAGTFTWSFKVPPRCTTRTNHAGVVSAHVHAPSGANASARATFSIVQ